MNTKICSRCNNKYEKSFFEKNRRQCKNCMREIRKLFVRKYRTDYTDLDKKANYIKQKEWIKNNEQHLKSVRNEYQKKRKKSDPLFRIRVNISSAISHALRRQRSSKNNDSCLNYLSYSFEDLQLHIEKQFEPWMNWNNYGKYNSHTWKDEDSSTWTWQLDHIVPQSDLSFSSMAEENFKKCWALENLRPYSAKQNHIDGVSRVRHSI